MPYLVAADLPTVPAGERFRALLELGRAGRTFVKLSGHVKYSRLPYPWADTRPYVDALIEALAKAQKFFAV